MIEIIGAYACLISILILFQRFINNYLTEGFETMNKMANDKNINKQNEELSEKDNDKKSMAQKEVEKSLKTDFVKEINKKKQKQKQIDNIPKLGNNTPKFHKPSKSLYRAYGWTKVPPNHGQLFKTSSKCILIQLFENQRIKVIP